MVFRLAALLFFTAASFATFGQSVLLDDFNRLDNSTVGNSWTETETTLAGNSISTNLLKCGSSTAGREFCVRDVSAMYNTVYNTNSAPITWMWNMRQTRTDPSGFDPNNYGIAYVLGSNSSNFLTGYGYAVVLGNSGTSDNLRLVKFSAGIATNAGLVNIIAPVVDYGSEYLTVKVTYNPVGNLWSLYVGTNLAAFVDPLLATYTQLGATTADNTYTGNDLLYTGTFWNHATGSTDFGWYDNIYIPSACTTAPEPTLPTSSLTFASIGANSVSLNYTRGNGSECIIIAHKAGVVTTTPVDNIAYNANTTFGLGTLMATDEYVVYTGSSSSITINGLLPSTSYTFKIFEFNGTGCATNYLIPAAVTGTVSTTPCALNAEPTIGSSAASVSGIGTNAMTVSYTRGNGAYCIVICNANAAVSAIPIDATAYTSSTIYGMGNAILPGQHVVYVGTSNTVTVTGLLPSTSYHFAVFEMNGTGCNTNYLLPGTLTNATTLNVSSYNYYFGTLHSHSDYSDGDMDNVCNGANSATCCYDIGNTAMQFDFMGISDHNHNEGPVMTLAKFASGVSEAATYNSTHTDFVALYGQEWGTISTGGHTNVYGINQLIGWNAANYNVYCAKGDYNSLFNMTANTAGAFATLCHPNDNDFANLKNTPYNINYDNAIVGAAVRSGPYNSTSTAYNNPTFTNYVWYWNALLAKGYHLGPLDDLDNHNSNTMGKCSEQRTAMLATSLTKANIMDAAINMRFYSTDDYNLQISFTANGNLPMGSIVSQSINPVLNVLVTDPNGDNYDSIRIWYGIPGSGALPTVLTSVANSNTLAFTHNFSSGTYYYYAEIKQADGNMAWTSPIWYTKISTPLPVSVISFTGNNRSGINHLQWITANETNNKMFVVERSADAYNYEAIGYVQGAGNAAGNQYYMYDDDKLSKSLYYYRLRQVDYNGNAAYTNTVMLRNYTPSTFAIYPNPTHGDFTVWAHHNELIQSIEVYDAAGKCVFSLHDILQSFGNVHLRENSKGIYLLRIASADTVVTQKIVVE